MASLFHGWDRMKLPVSKRLLCCASLVPHGVRVADVGCDHGYLGIYLLQSGLASFVVATDLRQEPLARARANAERFGTAGRMRFAVCDGLRAIGPKSVDTVVCAGMGGDTIAKILEECPWSNSNEISWIFQPQSSGNDLRRYLGEHGYMIRRELLVRDSGFLYSAMEVQSGGGHPLTPGEQYASPQILEGEPVLVRAYLQRVIQGVRRAVEGICQARGSADRQRLSYYETALQELLEMREQYENRQRDPCGVI